MTNLRPGSSLRNLLIFAAAPLFALAALVLKFPAQSQQLAATYRQGKLSVTIPYQSPREGSGKLTVEVLDPEDHSLGRVERNVEVRKGSGDFQETIAFTQPVSFDEVLWQRLRYRFEFDDNTLPVIEGIESVSQIISRPVLHVLGDNDYIAGSQAALRVIVSDANSNAAQTGTLRVDLLAADREPRRLFSGSLNRRGTVEANFRFPAGLIGDYQLRFQADTPIGSAEYTLPIKLEDKASILLTTEKPIYQPGQTIHIRALAMDRVAGHAAAARKLTFEVEDARGNKVFRKSTETDKFGIASAEFALAEEVNFGTYHLRALMGDPQAPANTAEIALQVERYVLPKFKVAIDFDQKDNKPRRDYRPGDHVTGTVRANYFFGKPVSDAEIAIKASSMDVSVFEAASSSGKTDGDGAYRFDLKLPAYFAGRPLSQGVARALIEATVKDSAAHSETHGEPITISESPLLITAVPEGGVLIPNVENEIFLLASYPDGSPASVALTVHPPEHLEHIPYIGEARPRGQKLSTDSSGVTVFHINPGPGIESLRIDADDHHGNRATSTVPLETRGGTDQILLHTNRAIFKAGDRIQLKVLSTRARGAAYVDIVKNGQTILTRDLDLKDGQAELALAATPEMAGTLDIDAYLFGRDAQPVADHRLVFVQPADELKIETTSDAAQYKPGSDARIRFHVTNSRGEGVQAALGLQVVDEAVFALAEQRPGFAKVFFYLEQEAMKPRYEIHSLSMSDVVEPMPESAVEQQNQAARALFSATEMANPAKVDIEFGRSLPQDKYAEYQQRYREAFEDQVRQLAAQLSRQFAEKSGKVDIVKAFAALKDGGPRDAWNTPLRIQLSGWGRVRGAGGRQIYQVQSAGPDHQFDTGDDLSVYIEEHSGTLVQQGGQGGSIDLHIDHDRGPNNDRAEIGGTAQDRTGAIIADATVSLVQPSTGETRRAHTNAQGRFNFAALSAGQYKIRVTAAGFLGVSREFSVQARDSAVLAATLDVGAVTETVMVDAVQMEMPMARAVGALAGLASVAADAPMRHARMAPALDSLDLNGRNFAAVRQEAEPQATHVRSYFPEALYINPEILTDGNGNASIEIPIADSITTWRMAMLASTEAGALGSASSSLKVFQDFFVDLDLPVMLTQGDRVSIPVAIYNYSGRLGHVDLKLEQSDWYTLENDTPEKAVDVESNRVGGSSFTLNANRIGKFKLTLSAKMEGGTEAHEDIVVREIEVIPNGREQNIVFNGRLDSTAHHDLNFPADSIPDATSVLVRLYPGPLSQIIEGMDSILQMPGGCFEQTSSSTYPNVLALDYMKRTKKLTPETHAKAEGYIANGYQRLLTFEVPGGGFSWFGQAPANKILTAYGLMEFNDMAKVSDVDPRLIERTADWLARQQQPDGSWKPDTQFINEGATNRYNSNVVRITAYIGWSLANIGYKGAAVENAKRFIEAHGRENLDPYTLAVIANFAVDYGKDREFTSRSMRALLDARTEKGDEVSWNAEETGVYSTGQSAAIETTGLAAQALLKWGQASETVRKALSFISAKKQASGNWGTTQATIMALRALVLATQLSASDVHGALEIALDGKPVETLQLTAENNDLLHQFVFKGIDAAKPASVQLNFSGTGTLAYQVVGRYFTPWQQQPVKEALSIDVAYDRTRLAENDIATATATIRNNLSKTANMVMVDLGIPPGFDLLSEDLQSLQEKTAGEKSGRLEKFSLTATQAILYFNALAPRQTTTVTFRLRAKYPIHAHTFQSRVYEYYDPDVNAVAHPVQLEVAGKK
jgi:A-macroglobulin TED domain/Alpha-2-macroglobulin family/A-macroglobulin receptor binding domain/MG2 domain/Carboxypeptidase regulatory-like domain/Alpha-2-macroglobulin bait region domain